MGLFINNNENDSPKKGNYIFDLLRGFAYILIAVFIYLSPKVKQLYSQQFILTFCIIVAIYGAFRLWRGFYSIWQNKNKPL